MGLPWRADALLDEPQVILFALELAGLFLIMLAGAYALARATHHHHHHH